MYLWGGGGGGGLFLFRELKFNVSVSVSMSGSGAVGSGLRGGVWLPAGGIRASQGTFSSFKSVAVTCCSCSICNLVSSYL